MADLAYAKVKPAQSDAQALVFDHLSYLQFEACVKGSSRFWFIHVCHRLGLKKTYRCVYLN